MVLVFYIKVYYCRFFRDIFHTRKGITLADSKIPEATIMRLSIYGQAVARLEKNGAETISSESLSTMVNTSAAQIRKDLSHFGEFGEPGTGYRIKVLKKAISRILGTDNTWNAALVGLGRLGSALLAYPGFSSRGFRIVAAFDSDITKVGKKWEDIVIADISMLESVVSNNNIEIAILAVPANEAQRVADLIVSSGIRAILNFAPTRIIVPDDVRLRNVDLSSELEWLSYFLTQGKNPAKISE